MLRVLLLFIPLSLGLAYLLGASHALVFATGALAAAVLAEWMRRATDRLAGRVGPAIGGLLSVSFGSVSELVLAMFVLMRGQVAVVQAQMIGSILATCLGGLGLAIIVGGAKRERQCFRPERAGLLSSLLILVMIALLLPAIFDLTGHLTGKAARLAVTEEEVSLGVSCVLLALYLANLCYTLVTHRDVFSAEAPAEDGNGWSIAFSLAVLVAATVALAVESELISSGLEAAAAGLDLSPVFLGVIVLALVGTAGDLFAAAWFAHEDRMGLVLQICIGSAIQIALVVAPVLVIVSWLLGHPMTLVFSNPLHLFAIVGTVFIVNSVARDGETTWFEGVLLAGVYGLFGLAFFFSS